MKDDCVGTNTVAVTSQALAKWHRSTDVQRISAFIDGRENDEAYVDITVSFSPA
ncbi:hypothetical protein [Streptomyces nondiastaticus]|uniref:Uncharacterized protein n=1 Tax=Streptomyces nondiastaticus TaxID=3154512 RepID=A0ABW6U3P9_9ACTN